MILASQLKNQMNDVKLTMEFLMVGFSLSNATILNKQQKVV